MFRQKPFPFSILILVGLISFHLTSSYFSWYWTYRWSDIVVHILAGLWAGSIFLWLASCFDQINSLKEYKAKSFLIAFVSAAFVGVLWELIENFGQLNFANLDIYKFNTARDLLSDVTGGFLAYLYFIRKTNSLEHHTDILHPFYDRICVDHKN